MSYGIDTIKVGFVVAPSVLNTTEWKYRLGGKRKADDETVDSKVYYRYWTAPNGTEIHLKYVLTDYKSNCFNMLFIEFSLPKLVLGMNYQDIDDFHEAFRIANSIIATIPGLPPLPDIQDAILYRIDLCANLPVGEENVGDYLQALHKGHYPHRTIATRGNNTVMFVSKEISTCIYDKEQECGCDEAMGILRYEISMRKRRKISEWTGSPEPTLRDITKKMVRELLIRDMEILHLDRHMICDRHKVEAVLSAKSYSPITIRNLVGYLEMKRTLTHDEMKQKGYASRHYERLLSEAGISSLSIDSKKTLPRLTLLLEETASVRNLQKLPSGTKTFRAKDGPTNAFSLTMIRADRKLFPFQHEQQADHLAQPRAP